MRQTPIVLTLLLTSACGPAWTVTKAAGSNPFSGHSQIAVAGVRFEGGIGTHEHRSVISRALPNGLINAFDRMLLVKKASVTLRPIVTRLAVGRAVDLGADPAELDVKLEVYVDRVLLEAITFGVQMKERGAVTFKGGSINQGGPNPSISSLSAFSDDERVEMLAEGAGRVVAEYIEQRLAGQ